MKRSDMKLTSNRFMIFPLIRPVPSPNDGNGDENFTAFYSKMEGQRCWCRMIAVGASCGPLHPGLAVVFGHGHRGCDISGAGQVFSAGNVSELCAKLPKAPCNCLQSQIKIPNAAQAISARGRVPFFKIATGVAPPANCRSALGRAFAA
jgi:hypothetical protein